MLWSQDLGLSSLLNVVGTERPELSLVDVMGFLMILGSSWGWDSQVTVLWVLGNADLEALILRVNLVHEGLLNISHDSVWEGESNNSSNLRVTEVALWWLADLGEVHLRVDASEVDLIVGNNTVDVASDRDLLAISLIG